MNRPHNSTSNHLVRSENKKSILPLKQASKARTPITKRLFRFKGLSLGVAVSILLVASALCTSLFTGSALVKASSESIATFSSTDCTTPQTSWRQGQTACAVVTGTIVERHIAWIAPDGSVARVGPSFTGTGSDQYTLLTTGPFAQTGTWKVESMDNAGAGFAVASFLVLDPVQPLNADLSILKFGPNEAFAGNNIAYTIQVTNGGPDTAQLIVITDPGPNNSTFASEAQNSGPTAACTNPSAGGTGTSTCP